ncbi:MAG: alkaline shock response membrane anchor protein AmaP [Chromatiales bacterium]|nr:alkaline shock response membrane anchor protein AmaP [Chromatiales bacterium]
MNETLKIILALIAFLALVAGLGLVVGYAIYYDLDFENQQRFSEMLSQRTELLAGLGLLCMTILGGTFVIAYQVHVKGSLKVVEGIHIVLKANSSHRIELAGPHEIRLMVRAVNELAEHSETLARDLAAKVAQGKSSVEEEKNRPGWRRSCPGFPKVCWCATSMGASCSTTAGAAGPRRPGQPTQRGCRLAHRSRAIRFRSHGSQPAGPRPGGRSSAAGEERSRSERAVRDRHPPGATR